MVMEELKGTSLEGKILEEKSAIEVCSQNGRNVTAP